MIETTTFTKQALRRATLEFISFFLGLSLLLSLISGCADLGDPIQSLPVGMNNPPVLNPVGERYASVNNVFQLIVSASDSESTPTLTALNLPAAATFVDSGNGRGLFSWTPMPIHANSISAVTFVATDDSMSAVSEIVALNVIDYTFNNFIDGIAQAYCTLSGCHRGVDSTSAFSVSSYESFLAGGLKGNGIVPQDTAASVVFQKLGADPPFGSRMPLFPIPGPGDGFLPASAMDSIARWILAGAPES
jgi:hypothetical protein